jgi:translocator protein
MPKSDLTRAILRPILPIRSFSKLAEDRVAPPIEQIMFGRIPSTDLGSNLCSRGRLELNAMKWFLTFLVLRLTIARVAGGKARFFREPWYQDSQQSSLTPPDWVFGLVWPINYVTSSIAAARFVYQSAGIRRNYGIALWLLQACSTSVWTRIFGEMRRPEDALLGLIGSWLLALKTAKTFKFPSPAALWMMPLCLWLTLACQLNAEFVSLNRSSGTAFK